MKVKLGVLIGGAVVSGLLVYRKIKVRKIGPCSPELEDALNSKQ